MENNKNKDIYIDADAFIAISKKDDSNHDKALELSNYLDQKNYSFYTSDFTLSEVITVLSYKVSKKAGNKFLKRIRKDNSFIILDFSDEIKRKADKIFLNQDKNRGVSYFDCINMSLMDSVGINKVFSFDSVYKRNNFLLADNLK